MNGELELNLARQVELAHRRAVVEDFIIWARSQGDLRITNERMQKLLSDFFEMDLEEASQWR